MKKEKLKLSKKIVLSLSENEQKRAFGGANAVTTMFSCDTCTTATCPISTVGDCTGPSWCPDMCPPPASYTCSAIC